MRSGIYSKAEKLNLPDPIEPEKKLICAMLYRAFLDATGQTIEKGLRIPHTGCKIKDSALNWIFDKNINKQDNARWWTEPSGLENAQAEVQRAVLENRGGHAQGIQFTTRNFVSRLLF